MSPPEPDALRAMREEIDALDRTLLETLARRRAVVARLRETKARLALPRLDGARESAVRERWVSIARERGTPEVLTLAVLDAVLADSRALVSE